MGVNLSTKQKRITSARWLYGLSSIGNSSPCQGKDPDRIRGIVFPLLMFNYSTIYWIFWKDYNYRKNRFSLFAWCFIVRKMLSVFKFAKCRKGWISQQNRNDLCLPGIVLVYSINTKKIQVSITVPGHFSLSWYLILQPSAEFSENSS